MGKISGKLRSLIIWGLPFVRREEE